MYQKFESRVSLIKNEISNISKNINNVRNKNHKTMTTIVKKLKRFPSHFKFSQNDVSVNTNQPIN